MPYGLYRTDACILNPKPQYNVCWINMVGLEEDAVSVEVARLFEWMEPKTNSADGSAIVQSVKIERMLTFETRFHVRIELRSDEHHHLDYDELTTKITENEVNLAGVRQQCWVGALQPQKQKTILFYARKDISGTGLLHALMEDPTAIQEVFASSSSSMLPFRRDLLRLSQAFRRIGYVQKMFIDGTEECDDDDGHPNDEQVTTTPRRLRSVNLASILDTLAGTTSLNNVILVHLDADGLYNTAAIRVPLRINASKTQLSSSFDFAKDNFHRILVLRDLPHDLFHLIGHMPSDVKQIYASIQDKKHVRNPSMVSASSKTDPSKASLLPPGVVQYAMLHTYTDTLDHHPSFLSQVLLALHGHHRKIVKMDAFKLIQSLDISIIMEDDPLTPFSPHHWNHTLIDHQPKDTQQQSLNALLQSLPNGRISRFLPLYLEVPPTVITLSATRISANCIKDLITHAAPFTQQFGCVRQLSVASLSRCDVEGSPAISHARNATEDEIASLNEVDCMEILLHTKEAPAGTLQQTYLDDLHHLLRKLGREHGADINVMADTFSRRNRRVASFDMDSTLIQMECIDEMAAYCGVGEEVKRITHRAMCGELDFRKALKERVKLLKGANADGMFNHVYNSIVYTPHAKFVCHVLRALGFETAVFSGGFFPTASSVQRQLKLQHARANLLELDPKSGVLTGGIVPDTKIIDSDAKAHSLQRICTESFIDSDLSLAVGDGMNDLKMLQAAGLGIAFLAKPALLQQTKYHINLSTLSPVLYLLGLSRDDCFVLLNEAV